jgi:hypothetical protein
MINFHILLFYKPDFKCFGWQKVNPIGDKFGFPYGVNPFESRDNSVLLDHWWTENLSCHQDIQEAFMKPKAERAADHTSKI